MASVLLIVHSYFRWLVLLAGVYAVARMAIGQSRNSPLTAADRTAGRLFVASLDLQLLLGVWLFAVSPVTRGAMKDMAAAMQDAHVRFFVTEHPGLMILALIVAHGASSWSRKAAADRDKFRRAGLGYAFAMGLILAGIPWFRLGVA